MPSHIQQINMNYKKTTKTHNNSDMYVIQIIIMAVILITIDVNMCE